jgi:hypothetical protein
MSEFTTELLRIMGIKRNVSTAYHPQTDGQTERLNQEIHQYLHVFINYHMDDWVEWMPMAVFAYNTKQSSSLGTSPFYMAKGRKSNQGTEPRRPTTARDAKQFTKHMDFMKAKAVAHLTRSKRDMKHFYDEGRQDQEFEEGDWVWLDASNITTGRPKAKWDWARLRPHKIIKKISRVVYKLLLPRSYKIHDVFHVSRLLPNTPDTFR